MGSAKYVGRVGALAVALGIGTALATPAWAETPSADADTTSANAPAESATEASTPNTGQPAPPTEDGSGDGEDAIDADAAVNAGETAEQGEDTAESIAPVPVDPVVVDPVPVDPVVVDDPVETPSSPPPAVLPGVASGPHEDDDSTHRRPEPTIEMSGATRAAEPVADDHAVSRGLSASPDADVFDAEVNVSAFAAIPAPPGTPAPAPLVSQPKSPIGVIFGGPAQLLRIAGQAITMLFNPGPSTPGDPPLLLAVLAFARREIQRTFFNSTPEAVADTATTAEGVATDIAVLTNDTDADISTGPGTDDVLTVRSFTQGAHGTVVLNTDGTFTYTPNAGFSGTDTFDYTVSDEASPWHVHNVFSLLLRGHDSTATVSVTVTPAGGPPTANDDRVSVDEDTTAVIDVLGNDVGADLVATVVDGPSNGSVTKNADGTFTYTPDEDFYGADSFTYTAANTATSNVAVVSITVDPIGDAPVIESVTSAPGVGNTWVVTVTATDADGDPVTVSLVAGDGENVGITRTGDSRFTVTVNPAWAQAHPGSLITGTVQATDGADDVTVTAPIGAVNNAVGLGTSDGGPLEIPALPAGVTYVSADIGGQHTVLLRSDGTAIGAGSNDSGQLDIPPPPAGLVYTQVVAGNRHTVLLLSDGTAVAFGANDFGQIDIPELDADVTYVQIDAAGDHTVLLRSDGTVAAFGYGDDGQLEIPELDTGQRYSAISTNTYHTVLLRSDGTAVAAGRYQSGQTDIPDAEPGNGYSVVAAGMNHTVLIRADGTAIAVGAGTGDQLDIPELPPGVTYVQIVIGDDHTVLLRSDDVVVALGSNEFGQSEIPDPSPRITYVGVAAGASGTILLTESNYKPVAAADFANANEDSSVVIDVLNNDVSLTGGDLTITGVEDPAYGSVTVGANGSITYVPDANFFGSDSFTYTVSDGLFTNTGTVTVDVALVDNDPAVIQSVVTTPGPGNSWIVTVTGFDPDGDPLDVTLTVDDPSRVTVTPIVEESLRFARAFSVPGAQPTEVQFEVTVTDEDWALTHPGAPVGISVSVSDGTHPPVTDAVTVGTVTNVIGVGSNYNGQLDIPGAPAGLSYTKIVTGQLSVALLSDGTAVVFGTDEEFPIEIPPLPTGLTYTDVAAGVFHVVLLRSDGQVVAVGANDGGQLDIPSLPEGLTYTAVAAGDLFTAVLRSDGVLIALGEAAELEEWSLPVLPDGLTYTQLTGGMYHLMALRSDGQVFVVGGGGLGEDDVPPLPTGLSYTAMAAGGAFSLLLRSDGQAFGFGYNYFGQSTVPTLPEGVSYTGIAAGTYHSVFLRSDGTAVAVGMFFDDGEYSIPELPAGVKYVGVSAGIASTVLLTATV